MPDLNNSTPITNPVESVPASDNASGTLPAVNSAVQASNPLPASSASPAPAIQQGSLSQSDANILAANWQQRISDLQSLADKRLDERNKSIAAQAQLQQQLTAAVDTAQNAINVANQLKAQVESLEGELRRYKALEAHPDLPGQYRKFLPTSGTEEELTAAIAELKAIREQDLARVQQGQPALFPPTSPTPGASVPGQVPGAQAANPVAALYGNRPNMNPMALMGMPMMPGSTPASMSPAGGGNTNQAIAQLLREAMDDPAKYEEARARAAALIPQAIQEQYGR